MKSASHLAKIIQFHRKKSGLTQPKLAELAGVGKTVVLEIEKGKVTAQWNTITKILNVLNIAIIFESKLMKEFYELNKTDPKDA
jgi:HTH-type transcriptional regulator / antitoxin HipB